MNSSAAVLAVDDNATIRKAISIRLAAKGYRVVTANDGSEALCKIDQEHFDLIILDLQMPGIAGDEVLRRVRQNFSATELPVIMLTASNDKLDINRSLELGANDYIIKPGDLPILLARIRTQLALKDSVAKLREHNDLMRDVMNFDCASTQPRPVSYPGEVDAFLKKVENAHRVPFDVLHDNTPMTCFTLNGDGTVMHANRFGARYLGFRPEELVDQSMLDLYAPADRAQAQEHINSVVDMPGRVHTWDIRHLKQNGEIIWMRNTARGVQHGDGLMVLITCEDIDDKYKLDERLSFQSTHDELTGLANRKALEQRLSQVIESARDEHTEHALAILDLDQFKLINDTCGHDAGDELLRQVARLLKTVVRRRDIVARVGGDEFAILIEDCPISAAYSTTEAIRRAIETYDFDIAGTRYNISTSVGIVPINEHCDAAGIALSMADTACYAAKDSGRNRIHTYRPDNSSMLARHGEMRWASRLNTAIAEDRFNLNFQPITPLGATLNAKGVHYEILIRMRDEAGSVVMPGEFLPAAERYSIADKLDRWVIGTLFDWLDEHRDELSRIDLCCINLSGQSIGNEEVLRFILEQFRRRIVAPEKICFEITETAAISDLAQATRFIHQLKEHGCRFALDDFGTGFSSFAYLKQLPVDYLKIDGSFVRDMTSDSIDFAMVRSINEIGHVMGMQTIAEFVETEHTLDMLRSVGVDFAQGYLVGRPTPLEELFGNKQTPVR